MGKIVKKCSNCYWKVVKEKCSKNSLCDDWIYYKANCKLCENFNYCKKVKKFLEVCPLFKKTKNKRGDKQKEKQQKTFFQPKNIFSYEVENEDNVDFGKIVKDIVESDYDPRLFDSFSLSDIKPVYNPTSFLLEKDYLGIDLFPRQLQWSLEFFASYCPYCSDINFIRNKIEVDTPIGEILDRTVLYINGECKKCGKNRYQAIKEGKHNFYHTLAGVAGQRSSKSTTVAMFSATVLACYLTLPSPVEFFGLLPNTTIHGTFVGLRFSDAYDNLWQPFYNLISSSKWFNDLHSYLEEKQEKAGIEIFKFRDTFLVYTFKRLGVYPSGPDKRKLRGRTRFLASIDELSWFTGSDSIKYNPDEIFAALDNSLVTIRTASKRRLKTNPQVLNAYGMYISSPLSKTDKLMRLYKQSRESREIFGFKYPTWEVNPNIKKEDLKDKFLTDRLVAERDFGANPPYSSAPYISNPSSIVDNFSRKKNLITIKGYKNTKDSLGNLLCYPVISLRSFPDYPCVLAIDCGYNNNSFACVLGYYYDEETVGFPGILEIIPKKPLSFPRIYDKVLRKIIESYNVMYVVFDRWESINLSQMIYEEYEIDSFRYSVNKEDFDNLKEDLLGNNVVFPKLEIDIDNLLALDKPLPLIIDNNPVSHLFLQLLLSKDEGRTVTKGDEITDDILRALCLCNAILKDEEFKDNLIVKVEDSSNINAIMKVKNKVIDFSIYKANNKVSGIGVVKSVF